MYKFLCRCWLACDEFVNPLPPLEDVVSQVDVMADSEYIEKHGVIEPEQVLEEIADADVDVRGFGVSCGCSNPAHLTKTRFDLPEHSLSQPTPNHRAQRAQTL